MDLLYEMIMIADEVYLWDNSKLEHKFVVSKKASSINFLEPRIPVWVNKYLTEKLLKNNF